MNRKLTRRQFGQLAIASTTSGFAYLVNKGFAQTPNLSIYSARPIPKAGVVFMESLNVVTGEIQDLTTATIVPGEQLIGFTSLANAERTLVLAIGAVRAGKKENVATQLVFLGTSPRIVTLSGLKKQEALESLVGLNDGSLIGLVMKNTITPPVKVVNIDINTGQVTKIDKINLRHTERFNNLTQCPNGTIYTTAVTREGETNLVQLDLGQGKAVPLAQLNYNSMVWDSGLSDLVCSPASPGGELLALGASRYETINNLYTVDAKSGAMNLQREVDVTKITAVRV